MPQPQSSPSSVVIANLLRPEGLTGVQIHSRLLQDGLVRSGFPCVIQTPFSGSKKWLPVFAIRPILLNRLHNDWSLRWHRHWHYVALNDNLRNYLGDHPASTVIAQCPLSAMAAIKSRLHLGLDINVTLVCHFNVSQAEEARVRGDLDYGTVYDKILDLEAEVLQSADRVIYVSQWAKQQIEGRGIRSKSSDIIWNGIPDAISDSDLRREDLGLQSDDIVLINVGTLEARKNQIGLIHLFAAVVARFPSARLLLVGDGPQRLEVEREIERMGLGSRVYVLGDRRDVPALLRLSDLYIHYAQTEAFGLALLEAARAGLPLAALPSGGVPEVLSALQAGISLARDEETSLQRLQPVLEDAALRRNLGERVKQNFRQHFTQEAMVRRYVSVLGLESGRERQTASELVI